MLRIFAFVLAFFLAAPSFALNGKFGLSTQSIVTATTVSAVGLAANSRRAYLLIQNQGAVTVTVTIGGAQAASEGIQIVAGGSWEPIVVPLDSIAFKSASSTAAVSVVEGVER